MNAPLQVGSVLAPGYVVQDHLSRGNVLDVYAVWSIERDCLCVAKVLRSDRAADMDARDALVREGEMLRRLMHPHLVRGYETARCDSGPVVVMETLTGSTLSHLIESDHRHGMTTADASMLGRHLCSVLHYLHAHGIVHRDLKPSNIVCTARRAVLLDLSLAGPAGPADPGAGTAEYMAPEQVSGGVVGVPADIWGIGGVLYRALTGRRPFAAGRARGADDRADLALLHRRGTHPALRDLVTRCLVPEPENRPALAAVRHLLTVSMNGALLEGPGAQDLELLERTTRLHAISTDPARSPTRLGR